ncbi:DUF3841 domain-containing protein [Kordia sp.]|uniref:DUF3841 domain-containing protein n=1 Tax=Kordia sp. TaxID=1965332 RepID=UPI003D6AC34F
MKVKLWTIQDERGWNELQTKGIYTGKKEFILPEFIKGYDWLRMQMEQRIGKPESLEQYPVWAWYQSIDSKRKRPDLRASGHLPSGEIGYRIEFEKEEKEILLSDFVLWHWPLCYHDYIAGSEKEAISFDEEKECKNIHGFLSGHLEKLPPSFQTKIKKSWEKIFDMNFDLEYYTDPYHKKKIQATFWELKKEEIIKVDKFIAR